MNEYMEKIGIDVKKYVKWWYVYLCWINTWWWKFCLFDCHSHVFTFLG
jgi:hypothetical protein